MGWRAIGASVVGSSHVAAMARCQDYSDQLVVPYGEGSALLAAVADGAGSAPASYHGAKTAVETLLARLAAALDDGTLLDEESLRCAFASARAKVLETAEDQGHPARDYASTLLVLAAFPERTLAAQLGDGAIVVDDGELRALTWPQQGEYANVTRFLTEDDALEAIEFAQTGAVTRAALFSDGLQNLALHYESRSAYGPFFTPFFAYLESSAESDETIRQSLQKYLESPALCARTDDDKSLVLAVRT